MAVSGKNGIIGPMDSPGRKTGLMCANRAATNECEQETAGHQQSHGRRDGPLRRVRALHKDGPENKFMLDINVISL